MNKNNGNKMIGIFSDKIAFFFVLISFSSSKEISPPTFFSSLWEEGPARLFS